MLKISLMMLLYRQRDFKLMLSSDPVYLVALLWCFCCGFCVVRLLSLWTSYWGLFLRPNSIMNAWSLSSATDEGIDVDDDDGGCDPNLN